MLAEEERHELEKSGRELEMDQWICQYCRQTKRFSDSKWAIGVYQEGVCTSCVKELEA